MPPPGRGSVAQSLRLPALAGAWKWSLVHVRAARQAIAGVDDCLAPNECMATGWSGEWTVPTAVTPQQSKAPL